MKKHRTVCLIFLSAFCGIGSGVLGLFSDGPFPALLFVAFPFVVAGLFLSIVHDVLHEDVLHEEESKSAPQRESVKENYTSQTPRAA